MSRSYHHHHHHHVNRPPIIVNDNDVLSGRGVNIAHHPGNERFRTLVSSRADQSYCTSYSASEKRAVAEEIIKHIQALDPPGRFLKREGRGQVSRGLNGPWEVLSDREAIKKTCQALRDCNRQDRAGYAIGVVAPQDVLKETEERKKTGLSGKQQAAAAAAASAAAAAAAASATLKRNREHMNTAHIPVAVGVPHMLPPQHAHPVPGPETTDRVSPTVENAAEWLTTKKQRVEDGSAVPAHSPVGADGMPLAPHPMAPAPAPEHNHHVAPVAHPADPAAVHHVYHHDPSIVTNGGAHHAVPVPAPALVHNHAAVPAAAPVPVPAPAPVHNHAAVPVPAPAPVHHHMPAPDAVHHHVPAPAPVHYSPITDHNLAPPPHEAAAQAQEPVAAPQAAHEPVDEVGHDVAAETDPLNLVKEEAPPLNITEL